MTENLYQCPVCNTEQSFKIDLCNPSKGHCAAEAEDYFADGGRAQWKKVGCPAYWVQTWAEWFRGETITGVIEGDG